MVETSEAPSHPAQCSNFIGAILFSRREKIERDHSLTFIGLEPTRGLFHTHTTATYIEKLGCWLKPLVTRIFRSDEGKRVHSEIMRQV